MTAKEISEAILAQHGIEIDKKKIAMPDHIKDLGETQIQIKVYAGISAGLTVNVEAAEE